MFEEKTDAVDICVSTQNVSSLHTSGQKYGSWTQAVL